MICIHTTNVTINNIDNDACCESSVVTTPDETSDRSDDKKDKPKSGLVEIKR